MNLLKLNANEKEKDMYDVTGRTLSQTYSDSTSDILSSYCPWNDNHNVFETFAWKYVKMLFGQL